MAFIPSSKIDSKVNEDVEEILQPQAVGIYEKWKYSLSDFTRSTPTVIDINGDGLSEIITTSQDNFMIYCLNSSGYKMWNYTVGDEIRASPIAADLDKDGYLEVIVGSYDDFLYCIDHLGALEWKFNSTSEIKTSASVADLDKDGTLEILFGSDRLFCLDHTGQQEWNYSIPNSGQPAIADIDNDDDLEIFFANDDDIYCLNHTGQFVWKANTTYTIYDTPSIANIDNNGTKEIIVVDNEWSVDANSYVYCFNSTGNFTWRSDTLGLQAETRSSPTIADIENDGDLEILVKTKNEKLVCLDHERNINWSSSLSLSTECNPSVADLDNDGSLEILITDTTKLYCYNQLGSLEWEYIIGNAYYCTPIINDVDGDGIVEIIVQTSNGEVFCLGLTGTLSSGNQQWYSQRGSVFGTGQMDSDSDYMDDITEVYFETNPLLADTDSDSLTDWFEIYYTNSNATNSDTDSDLMPDGWEYQHNLNLFSDDSGLDPDADDLTNLREYQYGTDPNDEDTDDDSLEDGDEVDVYNTNPNNVDTDHDGLPDNEEINIGSNPNDTDSDNDGLLDGEEEYIYFTDPLDEDTDDDILFDYHEIRGIYSPLNPGANATGFVHTDPTLFDTDGDTYNDSFELIFNSDPNDPNSIPTLNQTTLGVQFTSLEIGLIATSSILAVSTIVFGAKVLFFKKPKMSRK